MSDVSDHWRARCRIGAARFAYGVEHGSYPPPGWPNRPRDRMRRLWSALAGKREHEAEHR